MASRAKSYEVLFAVVTQDAPKLNVMNLQFGRSSTILASPVVSF